MDLGSVSFSAHCLTIPLLLDDPRFSREHAIGMKIFPGDIVLC
jgi:hypothetical protein